MAGTEMAGAELGGAKMAALKCRRQSGGAETSLFHIVENKVHKDHKKFPYLRQVPRLFGQHHPTISSFSRLCPSKKGKKGSV
uniref:Uncharacterized protein n=1 Tax=Romanomermis culicivorax TaxID=13658 RepID=A0A915KYD3_ROMCU